MNQCSFSLRFGNGFERSCWPSEHPHANLKFAVPAKIEQAAHLELQAPGLARFHKYTNAQPATPSHHETSRPKLASSSLLALDIVKPPLPAAGPTSNDSKA